MPGRSIQARSALEQKQQNFENRWTDDPEVKCFMPGVPRATYLPYPFRIIQGDKKIMIVYGFAESNRTIHMDKENPEPAPIDTWMGRSHGLWEDDTLVVDVGGFNGEAWFDRAGNYASNSLHVVERYTPMGPNAIMYEAKLTGANLHGASLNYETANYATMTDATLTSAYMPFANLTGANLTNATLTGANLSAVTWSYTTCPDGTVTSTGCAT